LCANHLASAQVDSFLLFVFVSLIFLLATMITIHATINANPPENRQPVTEPAGWSFVSFLPLAMMITIHTTINANPPLITRRPVKEPSGWGSVRPFFERTEI
jgi:hypothetical protein